MFGKPVPLSVQIARLECERALARWRKSEAGVLVARAQAREDALKAELARVRKLLQS